MGYFADLAEHRTDLLKGVTYVLGGFALVLLGTIVGYAEGRAADIAAGTIATTGIVLAFLAFFVHLLPPLLPAK